MPTLLCGLICNQNWLERKGWGARDLPKATGSETWPVFSLFTLSSTFIYFPSGWGSWWEWNGNSISVGTVVQPSEENTEKEKRYFVKAGALRSIFLIAYIILIFPFALSSPLWHSQHIFFSVFANLKALPPSHFANALHCALTLAVLLFSRE